MPNFLRKTGWVLGAFLIFDVVGVLLTLATDLLAMVNRYWETSALLAYAVWFVVGVFCAVFIYAQTIKEDWESPAGRREGTLVTVITGVVAVGLGLLSSLVWSTSGGGEPVAPDHRGVTITYLVTVVLVVALARFVLFREGADAARALAGAPRDQEVFPSRREPFLPTSMRERTPPQEDHWENPAAFRPAGFWKTLGFLFGVPVLLFLDASFFVLGPFDYFDRWTDPILTLSLAGGLAWGFAAARWRTPRDGLFSLHAPLLCGTVFYLLALFLGGVLVVAGVPERVAEIMSLACFWIGFALGCAVIVGWFAELFERPGPANGADRR